MIVKFINLLACVSVIVANKNNVCKSIEDYYTMEENPRCWYNFAANVSVPEIIRLSGYTVTEHKVTTEDGYVLTMFRIPGKKNPIFLQHGLVASCAHFLGIGNDSIAFVLAREGYDVWLGNMRGNKYSEEHVNLTVYDKKYWDYSMDHLALYDLPAELNYIAKTTGQKGNIVYIGHSLGTTIGLMYSSAYPEEARETIKLFIYLAPAGPLPNMISPIRLIMPYLDSALDIIDTYDMMRLVSHTDMVLGLVKQVCFESPRLLQLCMQAYNLFYGPRTTFSPELLPVYFNESPSGTSFKVINHAKNLVYNKLTKYDYGRENLRVYGSPTPPNYEISKIQAPVYMVHAAGDWAITPKDVRKLYQMLPQETRAGIFEVKQPNFNHIDLLFGKHTKTIVFDHLLKVLENF